MAIFKRELYLNALRKWRHRDLVKVLTGIRRCGKSTILETFRDELLAGGIDASSICYINFEDPDTPEFSSWRDAWAYIKSMLANEGQKYVFLDEIQRLVEFEKLVDGLLSKKDIDVYITGSNAYLLSGELATYLSGRYVEINVQPLSFAEYCAAKGASSDLARHYADYIRYGAFPYVLLLADDTSLVPGYLDGVYNTVLVKDVLQRKKLSDVSLVNRVAEFLFDNIGNTTSVRNIAGAITSSGIKTSGATVDGYLKSLCEAFLFREAPRYDIRGRELLQTCSKYYASDIGLRSRSLGFRVGDTGRILENIVYLELLRRTPKVYVGQHDGREVDFVTSSGGELHYYQVAETVRDEKTRKREFAPLQAIRDNYPKTLITLDEDPQANLDGIRQVNAYEFLLESVPLVVSPAKTGK